MLATFIFNFFLSKGINLTYLSRLVQPGARADSMACQAVFRIRTKGRGSEILLFREYSVPIVVPLQLATTGGTLLPLVPEEAAAGGGQRRGRGDHPARG